jgi:outer membrane protein assembly factor BamB
MIARTPFLGFALAVVALISAGCRPPATSSRPTNAAGDGSAAQSNRGAMNDESLSSVSRGTAHPSQSATADDDSVPGEAVNEVEALDTTKPVKGDRKTAPTGDEDSGDLRPTSTELAEKFEAGDWPMWGGAPSRNMRSAATGISWDFDLAKNKSVAWSVPLGSQSYGNPVVAGGKVFVGTNNGHGYRPKHVGDRGVVLCFNEKDGTLVWQLTREKLPIGQVQDWPEQGICSSGVVEGDRYYVVTNRCELMCVDTEGFHDGENDGAYQEEVDNEELDADIVWVLDMINELGVFPHNLATSSPLIYKDMVYIVTSNGVDEAHLELPNPRAPSFIGVHKNTGEVEWENNTPGETVLHGQWSSPAFGLVNGKPQVIFPSGNGWLYALDPTNGEEIWKCDMNPKETVYELGGRGSRNELIATPVFHENSVIVGVGQDPEHGEGTGHLWRIDATKTGDVSGELGEIGQPGTPNPNSGVIWHYGGADDDKGTVTGKPGESIFRRTMSTVAIDNDLVFAADLSGFVHCLDLKTGKRYWVHDLLSAVWGSPMVIDGHVMIGDEDGTLTVFKADREGPQLASKFETVNFSSIYSTPCFANGHLFLADRCRLYCVKVQ